MSLGSLQLCPPPLASLCTPVAILPSAHLASASVSADAAASEGETAVALGTVLYTPSSGSVGVQSCPLELADGVTAATMTAARTTAMVGASASFDSPQARGKAPVGDGGGGGSASVSSKAAGKAPVGTKAAVWSAASQHVETSPRVVADEDWLHFFGTLDVKGSGDGAILLTKPIPVLCEESALDYYVDMLALAELWPNHVPASEAASPAGEPRGRLIGAIVRVSADARLTFVGVAADASSAWTSPPELGVAGGPLKPKQSMSADWTRYLFNAFQSGNVAQLQLALDASGGQAATHSIYAQASDKPSDLDDPGGYYRLEGTGSGGWYTGRGITAGMSVLDIAEALAANMQGMSTSMPGVVKAWLAQQFTGHRISMRIRLDGLRVRRSGQRRSQLTLGPRVGPPSYVPRADGAVTGAPPTLSCEASTAFSPSTSASTLQGGGTSLGVPPPPPPPAPDVAVGTNVHFDGFAGCSVAALHADGSVDISIPGVGIRPRVARSAVRWLDGAPAPAFAGSATPAPGHASTPVEWVPPITIKNAPKPPPKHTEPWSCSACTLINSPHRSTCGACETAAPPPPSTAMDIDQPVGDGRVPHFQPPAASRHHGCCLMHGIACKRSGDGDMHLDVWKPGDVVCRLDRTLRPARRVSFVALAGAGHCVLPALERVRAAIAAEVEREVGEFRRQREAEEARRLEEERLAKARRLEEERLEAEARRHEEERLAEASSAAAAAAARPVRAVERAMAAVVWAMAAVARVVVRAMEPPAGAARRRRRRRRGR